MRNARTRSRRPARLESPERPPERPKGHPRAEPGRPAHARRRRAGRFLATFLVVLVLLAVGRAFLPLLLRGYVEDVLNGIPEYRAAIDNIDLNLWRGAYELEGIVIDKENEGVEEPFFAAPRIDLAVDWSALLRGTIVGQVVVQSPTLHFVLGESEEDSQTGVDPSWQERFDALFPLRIDRFAVRDAEVRFLSRTSEPPIDLYVSDLYLEVLDLTNLRGGSEVLEATAEAAGRPLGTGELEGQMRFDPTADPPRFELDLALREIDLADLNDFLRAYGGVDVEAGRFSLYGELAAADGAIEGYVKPIFEDLDVVRFSEIDGPGDALEALWEGFVEVAAEVVENQPHSRLATRIPLRGTVDEVRADLFSTVANLLRNAFVAALRPAVDRSIGMGDLEVGELSRPAARPGEGGERR